MEYEFEYSPLKFKVAQGKPSSKESGFPKPGPNNQPGSIEQGLSLSNYRVPESHQPRYIDALEKEVRK